MSDLNTLLHTKLTDILTGFLNQQNENPANNQKSHSIGNTNGGSRFVKLCEQNSPRM